MVRRPPSSGLLPCASVVQNPPPGFVQFVSFASFASPRLSGLFYETNPNANRQTPMKSTFPGQLRRPPRQNEPKSPRSRISKAFAACPNFLCVSTISFFHLLPSIFHPLSLRRQPRCALLRGRRSAFTLHASRFNASTFSSKIARKTQQNTEPHTKTRKTAMGGGPSSVLRLPTSGLCSVPPPAIRLPCPPLSALRPFLWSRSPVVRGLVVPFARLTFHASRFTFQTFLIFNFALLKYALVLE